MERFNLLREQQEQVRDYTHFESFSVEMAQLVERLSRLKNKFSQEAKEIAQSLLKLSALGLLGISMATHGQEFGRYVAVGGVKAETADEYFSKQAREGKVEVGYIFDGKERVRQLLGNSDNLTLKFDDVRHETVGTEKIVLGHTHPVRAYQSVGYNKEEIVQMQNGDAAPMPPSFTDIGFLISANENLADAGKPIEGRVADATGTWRYVIDINNPVIVAYQRGKKITKQTVSSLISEYPYAAKRIAELTKRGVHPENITRELYVDKNLEEFMQKCEATSQIILDEDEEYANALQKISDLGSISVQIAQSNFDSSRQLPGREEELIDEYIAAASDIGVSVEYQPIGLN